jgi:hypothetical protein
VIILHVTLVQRSGIDNGDVYKTKDVTYNSSSTFVRDSVWQKNVLWDTHVICTTFKIIRNLFHLASLCIEWWPQTNYALLGYYTASSGNSLPVFRNNLSVPSSRIKSAFLIYFETEACNHARVRISFIYVPAEFHTATRIRKITVDGLTPCDLLGQVRTYHSIFLMPLR